MSEITVLGLGCRDSKTTVQLNNQPVPMYKMWTTLLSNLKRDGAKSVCETFGVYERFADWACDNGYELGKSSILHLAKGHHHIDIKHLVVVRREHTHSFRIPAKRKGLPLWVIDPCGRHIFYYNVSCPTAANGHKLIKCESELDAHCKGMARKGNRIREVASTYTGDTAKKLKHLSWVYSGLACMGDFQTRESIREAYVNSFNK